MNETANVTDWGQMLIMGAIVYFSYCIYQWWKKDGRKKWREIQRKF